jgi:hypothetical protein
MGMRPCDRCLENNWQYDVPDPCTVVTATCQHCGHEVQFLTKRGRRQMEKEKVKARFALRPGDDPDDVPWR